MDALEASDSVVRVRVMSQLAMALFVIHHQERGVVLSQQAVEMARRSTTVRRWPWRCAVGIGYSGHTGAWRSAWPSPRRSSVWQTPGTTMRLEFHGRVWRLIDLLESGEMTVLMRSLRPSRS